MVRRRTKLAPHPTAGADLLLRRLAGAMMLCCLAIACSESKNPAPAPTREGVTTATAPESEQAAENHARAERNRAHREALRQYRVHQDLLSISHLADVDHDGLFIDAGTPARWKYTHGNWKNAWGRSGRDADRTFEAVGERSFFWFHVDEPTVLTLHIALRKVGTPNVVAYLNGETLRTVELTDGWQELSIPVPQEFVKAGENKLQLRGTDSQDVRGQAVSFELDWLHFRRAGNADSEEATPPMEFAPTYDRSLGQVRVAEGATGVRRAWSLDPGTRVRFHLEVPEKAKLSFGLGSGGDRNHVTVTADTGESETELWAGPAPSHYEDELISLDAFEGKVIALEFSTRGEGRSEIGLSLPQILVPVPDKPRQTSAAKNVVVLTIDTLRASKLKPYNPRSRVRTPAFSAFSEDATVFEHAQAPENWTKPSVASILTSLTPMSHGTKKDNAVLPEGVLTLGEVYKEAGFSTASFLANGYVSDRFGFKQGWDHYTNYIRENRSTEAETVFREAHRWIREHKDERFFVYIQTIDPHVPYDPPDEFLRLYDRDPDAYDGQVQNRRTAALLGDAKGGKLTFTTADKRRLQALHDAEISYHDRYFGRFIEQLKELGLYEDMVFVVTSDHGEEFEEHGSWGHGHSVYQELLHVPLVVRFPAAEATGDRVPETVSTMDIGPTVLEASGVEIPDVFEGQSLMGYLRDQAPAGPAVAFSDFLDDRRVIRAGRYKLILRGNHTWVFFDLEADPNEQRELTTRTANPVALRYARTLLGQYLGAPNRGNWIGASEDSAEPPVLPTADAEIDPEMCEQLKRLGYGC